MTPACVSGARVGVSLERLAFEKLGDGKEDSALLADVVDGEDVRMVQGRDGPRLPFEPNLQLRLSAEPLRHDLDRDLPVQPRVPSPIHLSHPARAERRENLIRAEPRSGPDHKSPTTSLIVLSGLSAPPANLGSRAGATRELSRPACSRGTATRPGSRRSSRSGLRLERVERGRRLPVVVRGPSGRP